MRYAKQKEIELRTITAAKYIIQTKATIRQAARALKISKSTVHKDVSERLVKINPILYNEVKEVLIRNASEKHIRGGLATQRKYKHTA